MIQRVLDLETNVIYEEKKFTYKYFKGVYLTKNGYEVNVWKNKKKIHICYCAELETAIKTSIKAHQYYNVPI